MYVVFYTNSTIEVRRYKRRGDAVRCAYEMNADEGSRVAIAREHTYRKLVVYMIERTNLMSGKKYMEPSNTPNYMSPASEAYWSM